MILLRMPPPDLLLLKATLFFAMPLLIAALGELVVERSGVLNIGIEGMMLAGAWAAWLVNGHAGPMAGFFAGIAAGMLLGLVLAWAAVGFGVDQVVTGTGINLLALGLTALLYKRMLASSASAVPEEWAIPLVVLLAVGVAFYLRRTRWGLGLVAVGESAAAADAAGVPVRATRVGAILFGAACAGFAGAYLSTMRGTVFIENMTEGLGFLALAVVIFGRWRVGGILLAGLLFGLVRAYADRLGAAGVWGAEAGRLWNVLPYVVSLLALAGLAGRTRAPAALGKAYVRQG